METELHANQIVFDGLIVANWGPDIFRDMRRGGLTGANCTCCIWEGFTGTMRNIAQWNAWFRDHPDLIVKARSVEDIRHAKEDGRTAIVLGFQNVSAFEDQIGAVELFKELGIGIVQVAYNTQNLVGSGCYESHDGGLSDFGREVVAEMNRVGILCDLSHVGPATTRDVILSSRKPVCFSHCLPAALKPHPRNKSDEELRFIADHGGFVGVTMFPPFLPKGPDSTVDDYVAAIVHVIGLIGEDAVGIGTDFKERAGGRISGHGDLCYRFTVRLQRELFGEDVESSVAIASISKSRNTRMRGLANPDRLLLAVLNIRASRRDRNLLVAPSNQTQRGLSCVGRLENRTARSYRRGMPGTPTARAAAWRICSEGKRS